MESNQASRLASDVQEIRKKETFKKTSDLNSLKCQCDRRKKERGIVFD